MAYSEVVEPADNIEAQFVDDVLHPMTPVSSGDFAHALLEPCEDFRRPHHFATYADLEAQLPAPNAETGPVSLSLTHLKSAFAANWLFH